MLGHADEGACEARLSAARRTDDAQSFACIELEREIVDKRPEGARRHDHQMLDFEADLRRREPSVMALARPRRAEILRQPAAAFPEMPCSRANAPVLRRLAIARAMQ